MAASDSISYDKEAKTHFVRDLLGRSRESYNVISALDQEQRDFVVGFFMANPDVECTPENIQAQEDYFNSEKTSFIDQINNGNIQAASETRNRILKYGADLVEVGECKELIELKYGLCVEGQKEDSVKKLRSAFSNVINFDKLDESLFEGPPLPPIKIDKDDEKDPLEITQEIDVKELEDVQDAQPTPNGPPPPPPSEDDELDVPTVVEGDEALEPLSTGDVVEIPDIRTVSDGDGDVEPADKPFSAPAGDDSVFEDFTKNQGSADEPSPEDVANLRAEISTSPAQAGGEDVFADVVNGIREETDRPKTFMKLLKDGKVNDAYDLWSESEGSLDTVLFEECNDHTVRTFFRMSIERQIYDDVRKLYEAKGCEIDFRPDIAKIYWDWYFDSQEEMLNTLKSKLGDIFDFDLLTAKERLEVVLKELEEARSQIKSLEELRDDQKGRNQEMLDDNTRLESELQSAQGSLTLSKTRVFELVGLEQEKEKTIIELGEQIAALGQKIQDEAGRADEAERRVTELDDQLSQEKDVNDELRRENKSIKDEAQRALERKEEELRLMRLDMGKERSLVSKADKQKEVERRRANTAEQAVVEIKPKLKDIEQSVEKIADLERKLAEERGRVERLRGQLLENDERAKLSDGTLRDELRELRRKNGELQGRVNELEEENAEMQTEQEYMGDMEAEVQSARGRIGSLKDQLAEEKELNAGLTARLSADASVKQQMEAVIPKEEKDVKEEAVKQDFLNCLKSGDIDGAIKIYEINKNNISFENNINEAILFYLSSGIVTKADVIWNKFFEGYTFLKTLPEYTDAVTQGFFMRLSAGHIVNAIEIQDKYGEEIDFSKVEGYEEAVIKGYNILRTEKKNPKSAKLLRKRYGKGIDPKLFD